MKIRQWILVFLIAALLAVTIRAFLFEMIRVATPAMTDNQKIGNRLIVGKWALGPRLPMTVGIPFMPDSLFGKRTYLILGDVPRRIKGFSGIKRNDLITYNDPVSKGFLDRSPILLSRCIGLPNETFRVEKGKDFINGKTINRHPDVSRCYSLPLSVSNKLDYLMKKNAIDREIYRNKDTGFVYLTRHDWLCLYREKDFDSLGLRNRGFEFDLKDMLIPSKGTIITLNDSTFQLYGNLINRYEGVRLTRSSSRLFLKNGRKVRSYQFQENYFFVLNDHQGYLNDSRSFGLLPERFIIGKAVMVLLSPADKRFLQKI
jgi:signal peptidase I